MARPGPAGPALPNPGPAHQRRPMTSPKKLCSVFFCLAYLWNDFLLDGALTCGPALPLPVSKIYELGKTPFWYRRSPPYLWSYFL